MKLFPNFTRHHLITVLLIFTYTYLCCIRSHKTIFRKQIARQCFILSVFDYKPVSQTVFWILHTRPLLLTLIPLVSWVWRISFLWYRQAIIVDSFTERQKTNKKKESQIRGRCFLNQWHKRLWGAFPALLPCFARHHLMKFRIIWTPRFRQIEVRCPNYVHVNLHANERNSVGQQLPTSLGCYALRPVACQCCVSLGVAVSVCT